MSDIRTLLGQRVLVLDGATGTMQQRGFSTAQIHEMYLEAGADIISTDSFNLNAISLAGHPEQGPQPNSGSQPTQGSSPDPYALNLAAARLARSVADRFSTPARPRFVAGSMGPTTRSAALGADVDDPSARDVTFAQLADAYYDQARGLVDGGADVLLVETVFDTLNAKAALFAIARLSDELDGGRIPVMVSGTIADTSGRILSGQTVEAFCASVFHSEPLSIGLNCAFGARQMRPFLARLSAVAECPVSAHPNAGLPNLSGGYDETPEEFAAQIEEFLRSSLVNIVGGCCGTTPDHIRLLAALASKYPPRPVPALRHTTVLAGLEPLVIPPVPNPDSPDPHLIYIGERANVAGSARFARLIREGLSDPARFEEAVSVARDQIASGASIVDICLDDGLIDGPSTMRRFLLAAAAEPELARVPFMIDSSSWDVLETGLQCIQGKALVNSLSLKEGPTEFLRRASLVRRFGAALVVMLFDESGQADTFERKIAVAELAYKLLTDSGFPPEDIVFDPNVLTIATGIAEHDNYAVDFIRATDWIHSHLPHARVSAGVSNLSFAFRGNSRVREAMHSVFLHHARAAGLDMAIVNVASMVAYSDLDPELRTLAEDVVLNRHPDATEHLASWAENAKVTVSATSAVSAQSGVSPAQSGAPVSSTAVNERITAAILKGSDQHITSDALAAFHELGSPLAVIDSVLMPAMGRVGELFGAGQMFLPQVVKSARVMRRAVDALAPYIKGTASNEPANGTENNPSSAPKKLLLATVRGDVHDIGKNIVGVVAACNGLEVIDLGVMVEPSLIADAAADNSVTVIGLSGLITPSLDEMIAVVRELERRGLRTPVLIGGATTSRLHTAVRIAPEYSGVVVHARDAAEGVRIISRLQSTDSELFIAELKASQQTDREEYAASSSSAPVSLSEARRRGYSKPAQNVVPVANTGRVVFDDYPISLIERHIDWPMFFAAWKVRPNSPEGEKLRVDALSMLERIKTDHSLRLEGVVGVFKAHRGLENEHPDIPDATPNATQNAASGSATDDIIVTGVRGEQIRLPMLRDQSTSNLSVADYVTNSSQDFIGAFALTAGVGLAEFSETLRAEDGPLGGEYGALIAKLLADRLTEAFAESAVHEIYPSRRFAFGYPATPDHSLKAEIFELLGVSRTTSMRLTDNYMITPGEALCGIVIADPASQYFTLEGLSDEQLADYARRRGKTPEEIKKFIGKL